MDVQTIEENETLSKAMPIVSTHGSVIVLKNGEYSGILDDRMILGFKGNPDKTLIAKVYTKARSLDEGFNFADVVSAFLEHNMKVLPVIDKRGEVVRVVDREEALRFLLDNRVLAGKKVADAMKKKIITIDESASVEDAKQAFAKNGVFKLVVVDARKRVQGILSVSDVHAIAPKYMKEVRRGTEFGAKGKQSQERVGDLMSAQAIIISPEDSLATACDTMVKKGASLLVVQRDGALHGVLTSRDVLKNAMPVEHENVSVHGLRADERAIQASIQDECEAFMKKWGSRFGVESLSVHIKSTQEGVKRRYEVKALAIVNGKVFHSREQKSDKKKSMWDAHLAVKETLGELKRGLERKTRINRPDAKYDAHRQE